MSSTSYLATHEFLDSLNITKRGNKWSGTSVGYIINRFEEEEEKYKETIQHTQRILNKKHMASYSSDSESEEFDEDL